MFPSLEDLWKKVVDLAQTSPFCFRSERYSHVDAAQKIAKDDFMEGQRLVEWQEFVDEKTRYMSNYSGD